MRFQNFKEHLRLNYFHNNDPNLGPDDPVLGLNVMSDWTRDEYQSLLQGHQFSPAPSPPSPSPLTGPARRRLQSGPVDWVSEDVIGNVTSQIVDPNGGSLCASNYAIATASAWSSA